MQGFVRSRKNVTPQDGPRARGESSRRRQVIAFANQKGGVAKTTSTLNVGAALVEFGYRVLGIDMDPQANLSMCQGIDPEGLSHSMFDVLVHGLPISEVVHSGEIDVAVALDRPRRRRARALVDDRARASP